MISVVVPVYNCEKYLRECLDSILNQTYREFELILVDDGSKDLSAKICDEYASNDNRIRVIHKDNEGACYARRDGVRVAKGEYISFVDSDDTISDRLINAMTEGVKKHCPDIISYGMKNDGCVLHDWYDEGYYKGDDLEAIKVPGFFSADINEGKILASPCTFMYRRDLILKYLEMTVPNLRTWEDMSYAYAPVFDSKSLLIIHESFYKYRVNEESVSKAVNWNELRNTIEALEKAQKTYEGQSEQMLKAFYGYCLRIIWGCFDRYYDLAVETRDYGNIKEYINIIKDSEFVKRALTQTKDMDLPKFELDFFDGCLNRSEGEVLKKIARIKLKAKIRRIPNKLCRIIGVNSK